MTDSRSTINLVTAEVIRSGMEMVCFEMATFVSGTAITPILNQSNERDATILDAKGRLSALSVGIPQFMLSSTLPIQFSIELFRDDLRPGDVIVANDPYHGGGHLPDFNVFSPVFSDEGELLLIASIQCHHGDTGVTRDTVGSAAEEPHRRNEAGRLIETRSQEPVVRGIRLIATGLVDQPTVALSNENAELVASSYRRVHVGLQWCDEVPVYAADSIGLGANIAGPALIQSPFTTVVLADGDIATAEPAGDILIEVASEWSKDKSAVVLPQTWLHPALFGETAGGRLD
jgi:Hydantoinase B/oxoprolinase